MCDMNVVNFRSGERKGTIASSNATTSLPRITGKFNCSVQCNASSDHFPSPCLHAFGLGLEVFGKVEQFSNAREIPQVRIVNDRVID